LTFLEDLPPVLFHGTSKREARHLCRHGFQSRGADDPTFFTTDLNAAWRFAGLKHGEVVRIDTTGLAFVILPEGTDWEPEAFDAALVAAQRNGIHLLAIEDSTTVTLVPGAEILSDRVTLA
jgi:hypothetical protein